MLKLEFIGNLTRDAEIKTYTKGEFLSFAVAVNEKRKEENITTFIDCTANHREGNTLYKYLKKGIKVYCEGSITTEVYEGKSRIRCHVKNLELLSSKSDNQGQHIANNDMPTSEQARESEELPVDQDLPF